MMYTYRTSDLPEIQFKWQKGSHFINLQTREFPNTDINRLQFGCQTHLPVLLREAKQHIKEHVKFILKRSL